MQTFLTDMDFQKSAQALDRRRLFAQIYEGIHILASLVGCNDKLVTPKRSVKKHPISLKWTGHEVVLYKYVRAHFNTWAERDAKMDPFDSINWENLKRILVHMNDTYLPAEWVTRAHMPDWMNEETFREYKKILHEKDPVYYEKWN